MFHTSNHSVDITMDLFSLVLIFGGSRDTESLTFYPFKNEQTNQKLWARFSNSVISLKLCHKRIWSTESNQVKIHTVLPGVSKTPACFEQINCYTPGKITYPSFHICIFRNLSMCYLCPHYNLRNFFLPQGILQCSIHSQCLQRYGLFFLRTCRAGGCLRKVEKGKCVVPIFKKMKKKGLGNKTSQSDLDTSKDYRACHQGIYF